MHFCFYELLQTHFGPLSSFFTFDFLPKLGQFLLFSVIFVSHVALKLSFIATFFQVDYIKSIIDFVISIIGRNCCFQNVQNLIVLCFNRGFDRVDFSVPVSYEKVRFTLDFT